jgi:DNA polymerase-3 subunit delta
MGALKAHEVERFLLRPDIAAGIFLAYGPDAGLVRETASRLAETLGAGAETVALDQSELDADPGRLAREIGMPSLFGEKRLIRIRNAGRALAPTLVEIGGTIDLPVILEAGNLAPRDALRAAVEAAPNGRALPCFADSEEALGRLIADTFSKAGIALDPDVLPALRETLGNDREVTRRELEKLVLFAGPGGRLTRADVMALCADNAALLLDEILDAMGSGHAERAERALERALAASVNAQQLVTMAIQHFAQLRRWRIEVDAGQSVRAVLDTARPKPHFSRRTSLEQQLRLWRDDQLASAAERLRLAAAESRRQHGLDTTIIRRAFLALTLSAAER